MSGHPHVLLIRRRYLGDIVLLGALLRNLRLHWPDARLTVLVERRFADVLALNPDVDSSLALPARLTEWPRFLRALRAGRFTHVLDLDNTEKTAAVARISGASTRIALHHGPYRVKLRAAYTHAIHDPSERHERHPLIDYYLRALEPLGLAPRSREVRLVPRPADLLAMRRLVGDSDRVLLVHPGSRSAMRIWPLDRFAAVCNAAQAELGAEIVLAGGPADGPLLAEIRRHLHAPVLLPENPLSLAEFAALARLSRVLLCHDSGPMHVGAAVGARIVALYGSQNATLFRPTGDGHIVLQPPLPCATCIAPHRCIPVNSYRNFCVQNIPAERVTTALRAAWFGGR